MPSNIKRTCKRKITQNRSNNSGKKTTQSKFTTARKNALGNRSLKVINQNNICSEAEGKGDVDCKAPFNRFATVNTKPVSHVKNERNSTPNSICMSSGLSGKDKAYVISNCQGKTARYLSLKSLALKAIQQHKIFTIYGNCTGVRKALLDRGWVEKLSPARMNLEKIKSGKLSSKSEKQHELERLLLSTLVEKYPANFIWRTKDELSNAAIGKDCTVIRNRLMLDASWTTKQGLCSSLKRNYWFYIEDVSEVTGPRTYNTFDVGEIEDFKKDYKITACTNLLKWVISALSKEKVIFTSLGSIPLKVLVFALNRCEEYLFRKQNRDIDRTLSDVSHGQWESFLKKYYRLIAGTAVFKEDVHNKLPIYIGYAKFLLKEVYKYRPQLGCEGYLNIWMIKPVNNSRGRGIRMASKLAVILDLLAKANSKFVIQKYIEDPLLIHETKFDIRQYYLVTSIYPLTIWMYGDCYLKFSSQKYDLKDYHEAIHLTNNAVQRKYVNCTQRHAELPHNNMWDLDTFKQYLVTVNQDEAWDKVIYPGMRKAIVSIMLSCQDSMGKCKDRFELYGCDFILDNSYKPWLIEINSRPDLNHTTHITAKICPAVVDDIIKVVIDYPEDNAASTGKFECVYRQPITYPKYTTDLCVRGTSLPANYFYRGVIPEQESQCRLEERKKSNVEIKEEAESKMQAILKKIEDYFCGCDTVIAQTKADEDINKEIQQNLNPAAAIIRPQLDSLMDRLSLVSTEGSKYITSTFKTASSDHTTKSSTLDLIITSSTSNNGSPLELVRNEKRPADVMNIISDYLNGTDNFKFSQLDDGPVGKGSAIYLNKRINDYVQKERNRKTNKQTVKPKSPTRVNKLTSKNIIMEATSNIVNFINKKAKEHSIDLNSKLF